MEPGGEEKWTDKNHTFLALMDLIVFGVGPFGW